MKLSRVLSGVVGGTTYLARRAWIGRVPKLFDQAYYLRKYPWVARSGIDPYFHYVLRGASDGLDPALDFNTKYYMSQVGRIRLDPIRHYVRRGVHVGLNPSPSFNTTWYLTAYPDVAASGINPLLHYRTDGCREGRVPVPRGETESEERNSSVAVPTGSVHDGELAREDWRSKLIFVPALAGVPEQHIRIVPYDAEKILTVTLLHELPTEAYPDYAARICILAFFTNVEIEFLVKALGLYGRGTGSTAVLEIEPAAAGRPKRPTLLLSFERAFYASDRSGPVQIRYAQLSLWDLRLDAPRVAAAFPLGCMSFTPLHH